MATKIQTQHGSYYAMCGFESGKWFQDCMTHGVPESKTDCPRISLTFRLTSVTAAKLGFIAPDKKLRVVDKPNFHAVAFEDMFAEIQVGLEPDITKMFGTHDNKGRMSSELVVAEHWPRPSAFVYRYGNKSHIGKAMGPLVTKLLQDVIVQAGQAMDWVHVTYYPTGKSKLAQHSDDEAIIAHGSDIACLTFMKDTTMKRCVVVKPIKKPKEPTAKKPKFEQWFQVTWPI
jgi:hypothetical protein